MARGLPGNKHYLIHFTRAKSPLAIFSKIIMLVEKRPYSHVCIEILDPATQTPLIFQASKGMVNFFYKREFLKHNVISETWQIETTQIETLEVWAYCLRKMGSDYGYLEIFHIALQKIFNVKGWFVNGPKSNICSELTARVCHKLGLRMPKNLDSLTPSGLNKVLRTTSNKLLSLVFKESK